MIPGIAMFEEPSNAAVTVLQPPCKVESGDSVGAGKVVHQDGPGKWKEHTRAQEPDLIVETDASM